MKAAFDQVITAKLAQSLSADVARDHGPGGWVVRDQPAPGTFTARLVTDEPTPYVPQAQTLTHCAPSRRLGWRTAHHSQRIHPILSRYGF